MKYIQKLKAFWRRLRHRTQPEDAEQGAITVAETLIALGIGATVIGVVFAGIPAMINARNASTGMNGLMQISTVVRNTYGIRNNFDGLNLEIARNLAGFPPHFIDGDATQHPWGGAINVTENADNNQRFDVTFEDMPEAGCTQIVSATQDSAFRIVIDGQELGVDRADDGSGNARQGDIQNLCAADDPAIVWTFGN